MKTNFFRMLSLLIVMLTLATYAPQRAMADEDDPPGRVARLSYTHGEVSFQPAGTDDWVSSAVNRPMTTGDKLWTDKGARAELHIGSAAIRLAGETGFSFLNLSDDIVQIRLTEGTMGIRLRRLEQDETFEVDTPNLAFNLLRPGEYRIEVNETGDTTIVNIRGGEGEVTGGGQAFTVHANQRAIFTGFEQLTPDFDGISGYDSFDAWCRDRDRREDRAESARYVSRDVIGYEDLDDYGYWRPVPTYGYVWVPRTVAVGWAPYRYGHWVWISPWGWTWVDEEPWGFAPFHYGRWVFVSGYWAWCPGPVAPVGVVGVRYVRPVYAPALVAWVGGRHWGVGVAVGGGSGVAWVPLGPREVYVPAYHVSRTYVTNINVTNTTVNNTYVTNVYNTTVVNNNIHNNVHVNNVRYLNINAPGAVTATSQATFVSARPVHDNLVRVDQRTIAREQVRTVAAPPATPAKLSVLGAAAPGGAKPPDAVLSRPVVTKITPPPQPPAFTKQEEMIQRNGGRPPAVSELRRMQPDRAQNTVPVRVAPPARPVPVETVVREKGGRQDRPGRPDSAEGQPRPNQPAQMERPGQQPAIVNQPGKPTGREPEVPRVYREDRPPSAQPANRPEPTINPSRQRDEKPVSTERPNNKNDQPNNRRDRPDNAGERPNVNERPAISNERPNNRPNADRPDRPLKDQQQPERESRQQQRLQQEQDRLHQQQDQERQRVEQRHQQELDRAAQDQRRQQEVRQQQEREHQQIEQKQQHQQQRLEQKQQKPQKAEEKQPKSEEKKPKEQSQDKPPGGKG